MRLAGDRPPREKKVLLFQGAISRDRQIEKVIELLPHLQEQIVFRMLGPVDPRYRRTLCDLAKRLGVYERIEFGEVPYRDLLKETALADAGIYLLEPRSLSYKYTIPNKFFEYLSAGIPVIVSNLPEMTRIVRKYDLGVVVNPEDKGATIRSIHDVLLDEAYYRKLKENVARAKGRVSWDREESKLIGAYTELLGRPKGTGSEFLQ